MKALISCPLIVERLKITHNNNLCAFSLQVYFRLLATATASHRVSARKREKEEKATE